MSIETLFARHAKLAELLKSPIDNAAAIGGLQKEIGEDLTGLKGGYDSTQKMADEMKQLRIDMDKQADAVREFQRAGYRVSGDGRAAPAGLHARKEMLRDGRCFMDDEEAKRFACHVIALRMSIAGRAHDVPQYVREIAADVAKGQAEGRTKAGMETGSDAAGGYVIADEFRPEIIRNVDAEGVLYTMFKRIPMAGFGTVNIPKRTAGLTAYWVAAATAPTESRPTFGILQLAPEKLMALVYVPNEFLRGSLLIDLGNFIGLEMVQSFAYALDNAAANGDGTSTYGGITGILESTTLTSKASAAGHTTVALLDGTDWSNYIGALTKAYAFGKARFGLSLSMALSARALKSTTGVPLYERGGDGFPASIDGFPFTVIPRFPAKASVTTGVEFGFFGDPAMSHVCGMVRDIEIASSDQAAFTTDQTLTRGIMHVDMGEQDSDAMVVTELV